MNANTFPWPIWNIILNQSHNWYFRSVCKRFRELYKHYFDYRDYKKICKSGTFSVLELYFNQYTHMGSVEPEKLEISVNCIKILVKNNRRDLLKYFEKIYALDYLVVACEVGNTEIANEYWHMHMRNSQIYRTVVKAVYKSGNYELFKKLRLHVDYLYEACFGGNVQIISALLKAGSELYYNGFVGACEGGQLEIAKRIDEMGTPNCYNSSLLSAITKKRNVHIIEFLLEKGAGVTCEIYLKILKTGDIDLAKTALEKLHPQKTIEIIRSRHFVALNRLFRKYNYIIELELTDIAGGYYIVKEAGYHINLTLEKACKKNNFEIINYLLDNNLCTKDKVIRFATMCKSYTILKK